MRPFVLEAGVVAAAEVTVLKSDVIGPGQMMEAYSIMAMDLDNAIATYIEIGIFSGTRLIPIDATPGAFAANTSHTIYWSCVVGPGQGVYAKFATPTSGDRLMLVAAGMVGKVGRGDDEKSVWRGYGEGDIRYEQQRSGGQDRRGEGVAGYSSDSGSGRYGDKRW